MIVANELVNENILQPRHILNKPQTNILNNDLKAETPLMNEYKQYSKEGVDQDDEQDAVLGIINGLAGIDDIRKNKPGGKLIGIGNFSGVVQLGNGMGLALCTDGVGTKILIAELMEKYDTIGIDCIAMNVNDLICVGAEPISMVDYLAMDKPSKDITSEIAKGLSEGARLADITIAGGEIASIKEMLTGIGEGPAIDLVGMAAGLVPTDRIIGTERINEGEKVIALRSSGVHSNGLTLARGALLDKYDVHDWIDQFQSTLGEELLQPTKIYVKEVMEMIKNTEIHAMSHITSWGITNLDRVGRKWQIGFLLDNIPEPNPIFKFIQREGPVTTEEMYRTFNMGIGFCIICPSTEVDDIITIAEKHKTEAQVIGETIKDSESRVYLKQLGLVVKGRKVNC